MEQVDDAPSSTQRQLVEHLHTQGEPPPWEYIQMKLCERFGWTPQEFDDAPHDVVLHWLEFMEIEAKMREV